MADLLGRMTLEEKIAQLRSAWVTSISSYTKVGGKVEISADYLRSLEGNGMGSLGAPLRADPWAGIDVERGLSRRQGAELLNTFQQYLRDHTRLRIPGLVADDGHRGQQGIGATMFPQLCGMGATWNPALQEAVARAIATEMRSQGVTMNYAPNLDVVRDPRFGRSDQNYGEDPWHVSVMGRAAVRGLQGSSLNTDHSVIAMLRAYPGCGDVEGGHDFSGFSRGPIDLHEVVLRPWRDAILEGAEGVMVEMSEIDAVPIAGSHYYLTELLRHQWGFKGIAMDDNVAIRRLKSVKVAADDLEAAALSLKAGMDLACTDTTTLLLLKQLPLALQRGLISMDDIDRAVARMLRVKFLLGLFENPFVDPERAETVARCAEHRQLAGLQEDLLKELKATGKPLVVVLVHGRALTVNWMAANADAVVAAWFPGEAGGTAVAEVLFGDYNPGGRLAVSFPKHVGQLPVYHYRKYQGRKYVEVDSEPLYPFGFGLSYTTFGYTDLRIEPKALSQGGAPRFRSA